MGLPNEVSQWKAGSTYTTGDGVAYQGLIYEAVDGSTGVVPGSDSTKWVIDTVVGVPPTPAPPGGPTWTPGRIGYYQFAHSARNTAYRSQGLGGGPYDQSPGGSDVAFVLLGDLGPFYLSQVYADDAAVLATLQAQADAGSNASEGGADTWAPGGTWLVNGNNQLEFDTGSTAPPGGSMGAGGLWLPGSSFTGVIGYAETTAEDHPDALTDVLLDLRVGTLGDLAVVHVRLQPGDATPTTVDAGAWAYITLPPLAAHSLMFGQLWRTRPVGDTDQGFIGVIVDPLAYLREMEVEAALADLLSSIDDPAGASADRTRGWLVNSSGPITVDSTGALRYEGVLTYRIGV